MGSSGPVARILLPKIPSEANRGGGRFCVKGKFVGRFKGGPHSRQILEQEKALASGDLERQLRAIEIKELLHFERDEEANRLFNGRDEEFIRERLLRTRLTNPPTISRRNLLKWADDGTRRS